MFWGGIPKGTQRKKLDPRIKVGWRGPAIKMSDLNKMPKKYRHYDTWWDDYLPNRKHNYLK